MRKGGEENERTRYGLVGRVGSRIGLAGRIKKGGKVMGVFEIVSVISTAGQVIRWLDDD